MLVDHDVDLGGAVPAGVLMHSAVGSELRLHDKTEVSEAFRVVGQTHVAAVIENLSILGAGCSIDGLHQSRKSVWRLRAIFSLFKSTPRCARMGKVQTELKWISDLLGMAREYDVLLARILDPIAASNPDVSGFEPLLQSLRMLQRRARNAVLASLRTSRISVLGVELVKGFGDRSRYGFTGFGPQGTDREITSEFVAKTLQSRLQAVLSDGSALANLGHAQQHRFRIRAKKLRYMIEPFSDLLPGRRAGDAIAILRAMQDALGDVNGGRVNRVLILGCARSSRAKKGGEGSLLVAAGVAAAECVRHEAQALSRAQVALDSLARLGETFTGARLLSPAIGRIR